MLHVWNARAHPPLLGAPPPPPRGRRFEDAPVSLVGRLDAVLAVIAECRGAQCSDPYKDLHPGVRGWGGGGGAGYPVL